MRGLHPCRNRGAGNLTKCPSHHAGELIKRPPFDHDLLQPAQAEPAAPYITSRTTTPCEPKETLRLAWCCRTCDGETSGASTTVMPDASRSQADA